MVNVAHGAAQASTGMTFHALWSYLHSADFFAHVFQKRKEDRYRVAILQGLDYLLKAQYANGGGPGIVMTGGLGVDSFAASPKSA